MGVLVATATLTDTLPLGGQITLQRQQMGKACVMQATTYANQVCISLKPEVQLTEQRSERGSYRSTSCTATGRS